MRKSIPVSDPKGLPRRVAAFCDWIESLPADKPFDAHPEYAFFSDLSVDELHQAEFELAHRLARVLATEQEALSRRRMMPILQAND